MELTISYLTSRRDSKLQWFLDSLKRECDGDCSSINLVIVDFYSNFKNADETWIGKDKTQWKSFAHVGPKPCVWQGPHKLTKDEWFAASNARNTSLCLAPDGFLAYCDDLSILMPGWLNSVREAMAGNYITLGTYEKRKKMVVENGELISSEPFGSDSRMIHIKDNKPVHVDGGWLFGCSIAGPVEAFLSVNGWPEDLCDGLGSEDSCMGVALYNAGHKIMFDPRMKTIESEEDHHYTAGTDSTWDETNPENKVRISQAFTRSDYGISPNDKSHAALNIAKGSKWFPNSFGEGGIRALRQRILAGEAFPIPKAPEHEWFTGKRLDKL
jgi:hypothetical protein